MPELPEVETIRRQITGLAGAVIHGASRSSFSLRYFMSKSDMDVLRGAVISSDGPHRLGRYLLLPLESDGMVMIHLGMTGSLRLDATGMNRKHDHLAIRLTPPGQTCTQLIYNDPRRFGGACLLPAKDLEHARTLLRLGEEPTQILPSKLLGELYRQQRPIKPLLMNNALVTGIGNIYANEICHDTGISPFRQGVSLGANDLLNLSISIHETIARAIHHSGSTLRNYAHVDGSKGSAQQHHRVYGRVGELCSRCLSIIVSTHQAGRSTFYCPNCQF